MQGPVNCAPLQEPAAAFLPDGGSPRRQELVPPPRSARSCCPGSSGSHASMAKNTRYVKRLAQTATVERHPGFNGQRRRDRRHAWLRRAGWSTPSVVGTCARGSAVPWPGCAGPAELGPARKFLSGEPVSVVFGRAGPVSRARSFRAQRKSSPHSACNLARALRCCNCPAEDAASSVCRPCRHKRR